MDMLNRLTNWFSANATTEAPCDSAEDLDRQLTYEIQKAYEAETPPTPPSLLLEKLLLKAEAMPQAAPAVNGPNLDAAPTLSWKPDNIANGQIEKKVREMTNDQRRDWQQQQHWDMYGHYIRITLTSLRVNFGMVQGY